MVRNMELKTKHQVCGSDASTLTIGGQVPAGMKRWVTFLMLETNTVSLASDGSVYFASVGVSVPVHTSLVATANRKLMQRWVASSVTDSSHKLPIMIPKDGPDPDQPLFSIGSGKWLGVYFTAGATGNVFIQYFDE